MSIPVNVKTDTNYTVHLQDMNVTVDTTDNPVTITLCNCKRDSKHGVTIKKISTNYHIMVVTDKFNPDCEVKISDGKRFLDYLIIKRNKARDLNLKFKNGTWKLESDK